MAITTIAGKKLYTIQEVAKIIERSENAVRMLIKNKKLIPTRAGDGQVRIEEEEIERFLIGGDKHKAS